MGNCMFMINLEDPMLFLINFDQKLLAFAREELIAGNVRVKSILCSICPDHSLCQIVLKQTEVLLDL